jgi:CRP/FNR family transcriptional regulator
VRARRYQPGDPPADCRLCPIRGLSLFRPFEGTALARLNALRAAVRSVSAAMPICAPGLDDGHLYTVFRGWAFSYRLLEDGKRQIVDFHLPGDLIGIERLATSSPDIGIDALTPVLLCAFRRDALLQAADDIPAFGSALSWMTAREGAVLSERLVTVGRRRASERVAHLLLELWTRQRWREPADDRMCEFPVTQRHLADAVGLTHEHVNRALAELRAEGLVHFARRRLAVPDPARLADFAGWSDTYLSPRPVF